MELFWLVLGVITLVAVCYLAYLHGFAEVKLYFMFPVICFAMFFFRRFMRNKIMLMEERRNKQGGQS